MGGVGRANDNKVFVHFASCALVRSGEVNTMIFYHFSDVVITVLPHQQILTTGMSRGYHEEENEKLGRRGDGPELFSLNDLGPLLARLETSWLGLVAGLGNHSCSNTMSRIRKRAGANPSLRSKRAAVPLNHNRRWTSRWSTTTTSSPTTRCSILTHEGKRLP